jgi:signal transduction histidine kinase
MKEFGQPSGSTKAPADLNHALQTTLTISRNEYKYVAEVETSFAQLPFIECHIGELNQAFLNLIINAAHAIGDRVRGTQARGLIRISTAATLGFVEVRIADTGTGIPEAIRDQVFEPFFTTKAVGRGAGQGLSIVRNIVVEKHHGTITFESEPGVGTTFILRLPIDASSNALQAA